MNTNKQNNKEKLPFDKQQKDFFDKVEIPFKKSAKDAWEEISIKIEEPASPKTVKMSTEKIVLAIAASLILMLSIGSVLRFYSKTIRVEASEQLSYILPDGSEVQLNAQSVLHYNPLWWRISRNLSLDGEAFFQIKKGSTFTVLSKNGRTEVLGTSFNIYSRPDLYEVMCVTGKVKVSSKLKEEVILTPDYQASIKKDGIISVSKNSQPEQKVSWKNGMFNFTAVPLIKVIQEIERQYDVEINLIASPNLMYTGFFSKDYSVEDVLNLVCKPFNLKYSKEGKRIYRISNE